MITRISKNAKVGSFGIIASLALAAASFVASCPDATANTAENIAGTQRIYGNIPPDQIEHLSTGDRIKSVAASGSMMAIWETLEHGERVECIDCIPSIEPLLYDANPRTREISAWLRRRIFGVFGKDEVYERTLKTLQNDIDPVRRVYAAQAVGEFLAMPGIDACASAIEKDPDARVRAAAASALGRLNDAKGLDRALTDNDATVKVAALKSAGRINAWNNAAAVTKLAGDGDVNVRRGAAELLGSMRAQEGVDALIAMAKDADPNVRNAACHSLGALHDPKARAVLDDVANTDPNTLVRDQAKIALRRL